MWLGVMDMNNCCYMHCILQSIKIVFLVFTVYGTFCLPLGLFIYLIALQTLWYWHKINSMYFLACVYFSVVSSINDIIYQGVESFQNYLIDIGTDCKRNFFYKWLKKFYIKIHRHIYSIINYMYSTGI
jgi:hypothetical protein